MRRPRPSGLRLRKQRQRGAHGGGIGVVAFVDQREAAGGMAEPQPLAPPLRRAEAAEREHDARHVGADGMRRRR